MISKPIEKYMACSIAVNFFSSSDIKILLLSENKIENFQSNRASINLQNYQSIHYIIKMDKILQKRKKVIINEKVTSAKDQ